MKNKMLQVEITLRTLLNHKKKSLKKKGGGTEPAQIHFCTNNHEWSFIDPLVVEE